MTCDNCHEDTTTQKVKVGFMSYQQWCELCSTDYALVCDRCKQATAPNYVYNIYSGLIPAIICNDDIMAWAAGHGSVDYVATPEGFAAVGIAEVCCEPDFREGHYVHQDGCHGSVEANKEAGDHASER